MRLKMDNPRFLFAVAAGSLVLFSLASTGVKVLGPCDCGDYALGKYTVTFINVSTDHLVKILLKGSVTTDFAPIFLSPKEKWTGELDKSETWTFEVWKSPVQPLNAPFVFEKAGSITGNAGISVGI